MTGSQFGPLTLRKAPSIGNCSQKGRRSLSILDESHRGVKWLRAPVLLCIIEICRHNGHRIGRRGSQMVGISGGKWRRIIGADSESGAATETALAAFDEFYAQSDIDTEAINDLFP
jgi:hypothetical protein